LRVPLWLEFKGRRVLVVGGGRVGTRRALKFLDAGAEVKVLSLWFSDELRRRAREDKRLVLVEGDAGDEELLDELIRWADMVVIATDNPEVNEKVWRIAEKYRRWVNDATNAERTEVVVPYEAEVHGLRIAVTSEGKTGVAARHARDRIVEVLSRDVEIKTLYDAMKEAKKILKATISNAKQRFPIYFKIEKDPVFAEAVKRGDVEAAIRRAREIIEEEAARIRQSEPHVK